MEILDCMFLPKKPFGCLWLSEIALLKDIKDPFFPAQF